MSLNLIIKASLVIIPTGGGKTLTAIRAIDNLIKKGLIDNNNKCLWVTHLRIA